MTLHFQYCHFNYFYQILHMILHCKYTVGTILLYLTTRTLNLTLLSYCYIQVQIIKVEKRVNEIVNRLNKTKEEKFPNLREEREERDRLEREDGKQKLREQVKHYFMINWYVQCIVILMNTAVFFQFCSFLRYKRCLIIFCYLHKLETEGKRRREKKKRRSCIEVIFSFNHYGQDLKLLT